MNPLRCEQQRVVEVLFADAHIPRAVAADMQQTRIGGVVQFHNGVDSRVAASRSSNTSKVRLIVMPWAAGSDRCDHHFAIFNAVDAALQVSPMQENRGMVAAMGAICRADCE